MVVRIQPDAGIGSELRAWGQAESGRREFVCPYCRRSRPAADLPAPCCPDIRALLSPHPISKFLVFRPPIEPVEELRRLKSTLRALSLSGWYRRGLDWQAARDLLRDTSPGTFLLRESGDKKFIFSLTVQTEAGPTSVRLHYRSGLFWLDCQKKIDWLMPTFQCAVELVQYYVSGGCEGEADTVWVDTAGCRHSPVVLRTGLRAQPASLAHAARLAVHRALAADRTAPKLSTAPKYERLPLPRTLIAYLAEYPYSC